jgi:hypothetical protein
VGAFERREGSNVILINFKMKYLDILNDEQAVIREIFGHIYSVEIQVFASPTGYMLTSSGFLLLNWGISHKLF